MKFPAKHLEDTVGTTPTAQAAGRRRVLRTAVAGAALAVLGAPAIVRAQATPKIRIGFWPVASGLPFYAAVEKGYMDHDKGVMETLLAFKRAGASGILTYFAKAAARWLAEQPAK